MVCRQSHVRRILYGLAAGLAILATACSSDDADLLPKNTPGSSSPFAAAGGTARPPRDSQKPLPSAPSTATPATPPASSNSAANFDLPQGPVLNDVSLDGAPSYLFLFTHTEDHINHELSEERYLRIGPMITFLPPPGGQENCQSTDIAKNRRLDSGE
jgi:hypothetical protein